jgi:hypothetical protein
MIVMPISLFQDDPSYVQSEDMDVEEQLKMGYEASEVPFEGKRGTVNPEAPQGIAMERGAAPNTSEVTRGGKNESRPSSHEYNLRSRESDKNSQATDHESVIHSQHPDYIGCQLSDEASTYPKAPSGYQRQQEQKPLRAGAPRGQIPSQPPPQQFQRDFQLHPHDPAPLPSPILSPVKAVAASEQSSTEGHHVSAPSHAQSYYHDEGGPERSVPQPAAYLTKESRSNAPSQISNGYYHVEGRPGRSAQQPKDGRPSTPSQPSNEYYRGGGGPGRSAPQYRQHKQIPREGHVSQQPPSHDRRLQRKWHTDEYSNTQQPFPVEQSRHASGISDDHFSREAGTWNQEQHGIYAGGLLRDSLHPDTNTPSKVASFPLRTDDATNQSFGTQSSLGFDSASPHNATSTTQTTTGGSLATQTTKEEPAHDDKVVNDIDLQIEAMATEVLVEVGRENEYVKTMLDKSFDPNLVCPICGKEHRIGEIQKFRVHVHNCEGDYVFI